MIRMRGTTIRDNLLDGSVTELVHSTPLYLNAGTGNAWAGHMRVNGWSRRTAYVREFSVMGNLGLVVATGSGEENEASRVIERRIERRRDRASPSPVRGNGEPLGRAQERERLVQARDEATGIVHGRKLGPSASHRFCEQVKKESRRRFARTGDSRDREPSSSQERTSTRNLIER